MSTAKIILCKIITDCPQQKIIHSKYLLIVHGQNHTCKIFTDCPRLKPYVYIIMDDLINRSLKKKSTAWIVHGQNHTCKIFTDCPRLKPYVYIIMDDLINSFIKEKILPVLREQQSLLRSTMPRRIPSHLLNYHTVRMLYYLDSCISPRYCNILRHCMRVRKY